MTLSAQAIQQIVTEKNADELLAMLAQPDDWQPDLLAAAKAQLQRAGVEFLPATPQAMASDPEFEELQGVANLRVLRKTLRSRGIGSIVWGLIAIGLGLAAMDIDRVNGILAVIGVLLTIEGIWVVVAPAPAGMIFDGFALLILGIWNIAVTVMGMSSGNDSMPFFGVLGAVQIAWGCQSFAKYAHFSKLPHADSSAETLQRFDQLVNHVKEANMTSDTTLVEFVTTGRIGRKGQLGKTGAVFIAQRGRKRRRDGLGAVHDLIVAAKQDVSFRNNGEALAPKTLKVTFSVKRRKSSGVMPQEAFQRYEAWKIGIKSRPVLG